MTTGKPDIYRFWIADPWQDVAPVVDAFVKAGAKAGYDDEQEEVVAHGIAADVIMKIASDWQLDLVRPA